MSKHDLVLSAGMSPNSMTKMRPDEPVALSGLDEVCLTLNCSYSDMIEYVPDERRE